MSFPNADLFLTAARPWSAGGAPPGADAIAIAGNRILAVGREAELRPLCGPDTRRVDCGGHSVTPALTDAHIHFVATARARAEVRLAGVGSRAEALEKIRAFLARRPGSSVLVGQGWDANDWSEKPDRAALDAVTGDVPALLESKDVHSLWVNSAALGLAGVTRATADPAGGRIERDERGDPIGILRETAVRLVRHLRPRRDLHSDVEASRDLALDLLRHGITQVHVFEGVQHHPAMAAVAAGEGPRLRFRVYLAQDDLEEALRSGAKSGAGDDWFRLAGVKLFADGSLGSRTAAMLEPYLGEMNAGIEVLSRAELEHLVRRAAEGDLSCAIHAIGDRANRNALDALEANRERTSRLSLPARIEHAQILHPQDLPRLARLGVVASMQPIHCTSDLELADRYWGPRADTSYAWRALLQAGATLAFGSDSPVESWDPMTGLHAAVSRQRPDGSPAGGWRPAQRLSLGEALTAYTEGAARTVAESERGGGLSPGQAADLVVWSADLWALPPSELLRQRAEVTVCDGRVACERARAETEAS